MDNTELERKALYYKAVECYRTEDKEKHEEAWGFLQEAAARGMVEAYKLMGIVYMSGQYDPWPAQSMEEAVLWYRKAADAGDEEAMYWLGQCYELGMGVAKDGDEAEYWTQLAVENGFIAEEDNESETLPAEPEKAPETPLAAQKPVLVSKPEPAARHKPATAEPAAITESAVPKAVKTHLAEEDAQRLEQEEDLARKANLKYRLTSGFVGAAGGLVISWILILLVYWFIKDITHEGAAALFWAAAGVVSVIAAVIGYVLGQRKAGRRIDQIAQHRKTPFYHAFGYELGHMNQEQLWNLRVYNALEKNYYSVTYRKDMEPTALREYRGCLYPHWIYQQGKETAQPEFVVLTEKAVYVIHTAYYTGRIQGDLRDAEWSLFSDGEKDLTAQKIPNMVDEGSRALAIVKAELSKLCALPLEQIPFYNVIFLNPEVDIKGLRRVSAEDDTLFVQGTPDKLRGSMGLWESRLSTHNMGMDDLMGAFTMVGNQFLKRSGW